MDLLFDAHALALYVMQQELACQLAHCAALHVQVAEMYNKQMVLSKTKAKAADDED